MGWGGTVGSDVTLRQNWSVFIRCRTMAMVAALPLWYQSISGKILTCLKKKEHFLAHKLTKLENFKENLSNTKHKSLKRFWSYYGDFEYQIE